MPEEIKTPSSNDAHVGVDKSNSIDLHTFAEAIRNKYPDSKLYKQKPDHDLAKAYIDSKPEYKVYEKQIRGYLPATAPKNNNDIFSADAWKAKFQEFRQQHDLDDSHVRALKELPNALMLALPAGELGEFTSKATKYEQAAKGTQEAISKVRSLRTTAIDLQASKGAVAASKAWKDYRTAVQEYKTIAEEAAKLKEQTTKYAKLKQVLPSLINYAKQPGVIATFKGGKAIETLALFKVIQSLGFNKTTATKIFEHLTGGI